MLELNHITFAVTNLERSLQFYHVILGMKLVYQWEKGAYLTAGKTWIALNLDNKRAQVIDPSYSHLAFSTRQEDFNDWVIKLQNNGIEAFKENTSEGRSYYFLDPDGHKLELHVGDLRDRLSDLKTKQKDQFKEQSRIKLLRYDEITEAQYLDFIEELEATEAVIVPGNARRRSHDFNEQVMQWTSGERDKIELKQKGLVTSTCYFLSVDDVLVGAIDLRHELNDYLLKIGGHIGYGVRKSYRGMGYAGLMLTFVLDICKEMGLKEVMLTCKNTNYASSRTIEKCGGILKAVYTFNEEDTRQYWINLNQ